MSLVGLSLPSLTPKISLKGEAFPHTYKPTTNPFHNRYRITPTISLSHIRPCIGVETTCISHVTDGSKFVRNPGSNISVGWSLASLTLKASLKDETFSHTNKSITSPFHNRRGITPASLSDYQTQNGKSSREASEVFESVFTFLMDFADEAKTIVAVVHDDTMDGVNVDEEDSSENGGDGNAGELFHELPVRDKEELLKDVFREIVGSVLDKLPEDGKDAFLVRIFYGLYAKLPGELQRVIERKVRDVSSQSQKDLQLSASESAIPDLFGPGDLVEVGLEDKNRKKVQLPDVVGKPPPSPPSGTRPRPRRPTDPRRK